MLAYLPMAWIGDHLFSYAQAIVAGFAVNCPESAETVMTDLREIGPSYFFAPPRIFENILTQVMIRMEDAGLLKRRHVRLFHARGAARAAPGYSRAGRYRLADRALYALGDLLVYGPLRNALGIEPGPRRLYRGRGDRAGHLPVLPLARHQSEAALRPDRDRAPIAVCRPDDDVKSDTAGPPAPGVEMRIADDGEIMYRSPSVFIGYYKNPEATAAAKTPDGWVHTGDAGVFTDERPSARSSTGPRMSVA